MSSQSHDWFLLQLLLEQLEQHSQDPAALSRLFGVFSSSLNPVAAGDISNERDQLSSKLQILKDNLSDRMQQLSIALEDRKVFWANFEELEKWLQGVRKKVEKTDEVYSDEVNDTKSDLQV